MAGPTPPGDGLAPLVDAMRAQSQRIRELETFDATQYARAIEKLQALVNEMQEQIDNLLTVEVNTGNVNATGHGHFGTDVTVGEALTVGDGLTVGQDITAAGRVTSSAPFRSAGSRAHVVSGGTLGSYAGAWIDGDGTLGISPSSRRFKTDIEPWSTNISRILELQAVLFRYNFAGLEASPKQLGFIAEELEDLGFPEFLFYDAEGKAEGINYDRLTVALLVLAQRQDARLGALEGTRE